MDSQLIQSLLQTWWLTWAMWIWLYMMYNYILKKDALIQKLTDDNRDSIKMVIEANNQQNKILWDLISEIKILQVEISSHRNVIEKK